MESTVKGKMLDHLCQQQRRGTVLPRLLFPNVLGEWMAEPLLYTYCVPGTALKLARAGFHLVLTAVLGRVYNPISILETRNPKTKEMYAEPQRF